MALGLVAMAGVMTPVLATVAVLEVVRGPRVRNLGWRCWWWRSRSR